MRGNSTRAKGWRKIPARSLIIVLNSFESLIRSKTFASTRPEVTKDGPFEDDVPYQSALMDIAPWAMCMAAQFATPCNCYPATLRMIPFLKTIVILAAHVSNSLLGCYQSPPEHEKLRPSQRDQNVSRRCTSIAVFPGFALATRRSTKRL